MNHRFHFLFTEKPSMPSAAGEACFFISESSHGVLSVKFYSVGEFFQKQ